MIDVHAPHETVHTWKDFFIHIATIVVGLCIAVGLEQTVVYFHQHHQIRETREALRVERAENRKRFVQYCTNFRLGSALLENNMLVLSYLQQHPGTRQEKLPGILSWGMGRSLFAHAAWDTAQQSGILPLMPQDEVLADQTLYNALHDISNANEEEWIALNDASRFSFKDADPSHLTAIQVNDEIDLTEKQMMKHYLQGNFMGYPASLDASFPSGPSEKEIQEFHHRSTAAQDNNGPLAAASAITAQRLKVAGYDAR